LASAFLKNIPREIVGIVKDYESFLVALRGPR
jgi:hypothetical protein